MVRRVVSVSMLAVALVLAALGARDAGAIAKSAWDQKAVTALAKEFAAAAVAAEDIIRKEPYQAPQATNYHRLRQHARRIKNEARELEAMLSAGSGHDETLGVYENLLSEIERTRVTATKVFVTESVTERIRAARAVLEKIAPYYDAEPLGPPLAP